MGPISTPHPHPPPFSYWPPPFIGLHRLPLGATPCSWASKQSLLHLLSCEGASVRLKEGKLTRVKEKVGRGRSTTGAHPAAHLPTPPGRPALTGSGPGKGKPHVQVAFEGDTLGRCDSAGRRAHASKRDKLDAPSRGVPAARWLGGARRRGRRSWPG